MPRNRDTADRAVLGFVSLAKRYLPLSSCSSEQRAAVSLDLDARGRVLGVEIQRPPDANLEDPLLELQERDADESVAAWLGSVQQDTGGGIFGARWDVGRRDYDYSTDLDEEDWPWVGLGLDGSGRVVAVAIVDPSLHVNGFPSAE